MMYREEELSKTPWVAGKPPAYKSSSSGGDSKTPTKN